MRANPSILYIAGKGRPRLVLVFARPKGYIASSSVANPTIIESPIPHKLINGMSIRIAGHTGSTPDINGDRIVTIIDRYTFSIPVNVTVGGTGGTFEARTESYESTGTTVFTSTTVTERFTFGSGSAGTSIVLNSAASSTNDYYNGWKIIWGTEERTINDYTGSSKVAIINEAFAVDPVNTDEYGYDELYYLHVAIGQRIRGLREDDIFGGNDIPTWAKITDKILGGFTIDGWVNGTPTNGKQFRVDGWIADLPFTEELTEMYDPDYLVHNLYNGDMGTRLETKFRGWKYKAILDYKKFISADTLLSMHKSLMPSTEDQLILIPRVDVKKFNFNVIWGEPIELALRRNFGYKKTSFVFLSKENQGSLSILDGYGTNYGVDYGNHL